MPNNTDWEAHLRALKKHSCQCGSGGAMACDNDCPGDTRDPTLVEALVAVISCLRSAEAESKEKPTP